MEPKKVQNILGLDENIDDIVDIEVNSMLTEVAGLAANALKVPIMFIGFFNNEKVLFKSGLGLSFDYFFGSSKLIDFNEDMLILEDLSSNACYTHDIFVRKMSSIKFYAAHSIYLKGKKVGVFSIADNKQRCLVEKEISLIKKIVFMVERIIFSQVNEKLLTQAEEQLKKNNLQMMANSKLSALGEMASGIAHEINNPLSAIMTSAGLLRQFSQKQSLDYGKLNDIGTKIESICYRIAKIVRGLKSFARDEESMEFDNIPIEAIIEDTLDLCREKFKYDTILNVVKETSGLVLYCNPVQMTQVLLNLLSNAYDACQDCENKWVKLSFEKKDKSIEISVSDSGPGVPVELRGQLLKPFFTTKALGKGTGIGLSVSQRILKRHGSELKFDFNGPHTKVFFAIPCL